jgi:hypothetical protein
LDLLTSYSCIQLRTTGNTALSLFYTLYSSPLHTHYDSVFTSRIQATDLSQSHCHFKSLVKSSYHSLVPSFPLFCSCQFRRLDSIRFLCSQAYVPADWRPETRLFNPRLLFCTRSASSVSLYNTRHGLYGKHGLYC